MQSFRFYNTIKLLHFSKALYKKNNTLGKSQIFNFGLAATQLLKHTNTSVKGKHKHHSSSTSRNTLGQNTRVKRYKLSTLLHFLFLFFFSSGLGNSQNTEHNLFYNFATPNTVRRVAGCPRDTERVATFTSTQISCPCWALQSNTERNLPTTFNRFSVYFLNFLLSLHNIFFVVPKTSSKSQQSIGFIFNNIQIFKSQLHSESFLWFASSAAQFSFFLYIFSCHNRCSSCLVFHLLHFSSS